MPKAETVETGKQRDQEYALWESFQREPSDETAAALVGFYTPLVCRVVRQMSVYTPQHMDMDDLTQHALVGVWKAIGRYDPAKGVPFEAFALRRIRGAVRDALRAQDPLSRTDRALLKKLNEVTRDFVMEFGRGPAEEDLARTAGVELTRMRDLLVRAQPWISLDAMVDHDDGEASSAADHLADSTSPDPRKETVRNEQAARFRSAFRKLNTRQQKILYLYYFEELTLKEIGAIFEISEARVCQVHSSILLILRALLSSQDA